MINDQWTMKQSLHHNYLPTTITSFKNIHLEADVDFKHNQIINCPTLDRYLVHDTKITQPIVKGSLLSYKLNNEVYTNSIIVNDDNINLADKKITNCSGINHIKFTDKTTDFGNKRVSSISNPKFMNDAINKGYLLENISFLQRQIDELKNEITLLKKTK